MPAIRTAAELLEGYGDVIDACHTLVQIGDQILEQHLPAADQFGRWIIFSCSPPDPENTNCSQPPSKVHTNPSNCVLPLIFKPRPKLTMFAAFSASLCQDVGQPVGDLEVTATNR